VYALGAGAFELLTSERVFDVLVISDLPGVQAADFAARARKVRHRRAVPQLVLVDSAGSAENAWKAGADAVLVMPEQSLEVLPMVARLLDAKRKGDK